LVEFPADDPERARRFWAELLGVELEAREDSEWSAPRWVVDSLLVRFPDAIGAGGA
jgi:catechol 2,3-dioxygenase-like lactoylglutathione lyase family enzyme